MDKNTLPELPDIEGSPFVSLEHFNVNIGAEWNGDLEKFWFEVRVVDIFNNHPNVTIP